LQNFAWWTYEFGVLENTGESDGFRHKANDIDYEIYGSGILSSYDETLNVVECAKGTSVRSRFIPFDIEEVVLTRFDYSDIQDRYYVIPSLEVLYTAFRENRDIFLFHD
jgi:phenylalanine-4-hydroxylase